MTSDNSDGKKPPAPFPITTSGLPGERRVTQAPPPVPTLSGSGGYHPPDSDFDYWAKQAGKPDWSHWSNMAIVDLADACCLSLDIDPRGARRLHDADKKLSKVTGRLQVAENNLGLGLPSYATDADRYYGRSPTGVKLSDFRAWGESLPSPFTFPDEFPKTATLETAAPVASEPAHDKPRRTPRNDNANLRIIAAMLALLRDRDGGKFPSDAKVIDLLVEKYGAADGISKRNLEKVFPAAKQAAGDDLKPPQRTAS